MYIFFRLIFVLTFGFNLSWIQMMKKREENLRLKLEYRIFREILQFIWWNFYFSRILKNC
jgi:hypothetical protein